MDNTQLDPNDLLFKNRASNFLNIYLVLTIGGSCLAFFVLLLGLGFNDDPNANSNLVFIVLFAIPVIMITLYYINALLYRKQKYRKSFIMSLILVICILAPIVIGTILGFLIHYFHLR